MIILSRYWLINNIDTKCNRTESVISVQRKSWASGFWFQASEFCSELARWASEFFGEIQITDGL